MKKTLLRGALAALLILALLMPVGALAEVEVAQGVIGPEDALPLTDLENGTDAVLAPTLELAQDTVETGDGQRSDADLVANAAEKLSVSGKQSVKLNVGGKYQLVVPGAKIQGCKSSNSRIVKASAKGLLTVRKAGKAKVTVKLKGGKSFVLTVKAVKAPVELSGYLRQDARKSAKKLGLTKKKNGVMTGPNGKLKYIRYYKGGVSLYNCQFSTNDGKVHFIRLEDTADYTLVGIHVGMALEEARKKLKKYEDDEYFYDTGDQLIYPITWGGDRDYVSSTLSVNYWNDKVTWLQYSVYME